MSIERGGLSLDEIFDRTDSGEPEGIIRGLSGRLLRYSVREQEYDADFSVRDDKLDFYLETSVNLTGENFSHRLRTRGFQGNPNKRHPDFFAGEFVGDSLRIIRGRYGVAPTHFVGSLHGEQGISDVYDEFMRHYSVNKDKVGAVGKTWIARRLTPHGFSQISPADVMVEQRERRVNVTIWRNNLTRK